MSQADILREAFFKTDKVLKSNDDKESYLVGNSKNQIGMNVKVFVKMKTGSIHDARYQVSGCPHLIGLTSILIKKIIGQERVSFPFTGTTCFPLISIYRLYSCANRSFQYFLF